MSTMDRRVRRDGREGQALVEFALVIPVLLLLLFGIVEFGLLLYNQQVITNASREGARYGIVMKVDRRTEDDITAVVDAYAGKRLVTFGSGPPPSTEVRTSSASETPSDAGFGDDLMVTVTFHYDFLVLPNFLAFLAGGSTLEAWTTMKYE